MSRYSIVPCRLAHLRELSRTMRPEDRAEIAAAGLVLRHALVGLWQRSLDPMTAIVDGEVAACWGDEAGFLADEGAMWLFTAPAVERLPFAYFREARREIGRRLVHRRALVFDVAESYRGAIRFFSLLGFGLGDTRQVGAAVYRRMRIERG